MLLEVGTDVDALVEKVVGSWGGDPSAWTGYQQAPAAGPRLPRYAGGEAHSDPLFVAFTPVVARFMGTTKAVPQPKSAPSAQPAEGDGEQDMPADAPADAAEDADVGHSLRR